MSARGASVTVEGLDQLIQEIASKEAVVDELEEGVKQTNKEITRLKLQATQYLKELGRGDYKAPHGSVKIVEKWNIRMPQGEGKQALFQWMRERGIYDQYATVQANSLKALFMEEREEAIKNGEDPMVFSLPGMEPATVFEDCKFTRARS